MAAIGNAIAKDCTIGIAACCTVKVYPVATHITCLCPVACCIACNSSVTKAQWCSLSPDCLQCSHKLLLAFLQCLNVILMPLADTLKLSPG